MDNINREKAEIINYKEQVFKLENYVTKLESELFLIKKKKNDKLKDDDYYGIKEVYITDPSEALICINDELYLYKNVYMNLSTHYRALQVSINQYEAIIQELKYESTKLEREIREKDKVILMSISHARTNTVSKHQTEINQREDDINRRNSTNNLENPKTSVARPKLLKMKASKNKKKRSVDDDSDSSFDADKYEAQQITEKYNQSYGLTPSENFPYSSNEIDKLDISEWRDVVRIVGFTEEEYNQIFVKSKNNKISEAIDVLNTIVIDKNKQISLLNLENSKLNNENKVLYDENLICTKKISQLESKNSSLAEKLEDLKKIHSGCNDKDNRKNSHIEMSSTRYDNYRTIDTNKNEILFNSVSNTPTSMLTLNKVNIKSLSQINNIKHYDKSNNSNTMLDYYKNLNIPDDSSSTEFEDDIHNFKSANITTNHEQTSASTIMDNQRKRLFSIHPKSSEKRLSIQIPIAKTDNSNKQTDSKETVTKRSLNTVCIQPSLCNDDTTRDKRDRSTSLKSRVLERISKPNSGMMKNLVSPNKSDFIKIEDQKDGFFELSNNIKAIHEISNINFKDTSSRSSNILPKGQPGNVASKAMDKILNLQKNGAAENCLISTVKSNAGITQIRQEINNDLKNLIDLFDDDRIEEIRTKDPKQFTFDTCNSKQFQTDLETYNSGTNLRKDEEINIDAPSIRLN